MAIFSKFNLATGHPEKVLILRQNLLFGRLEVLEHEVLKSRTITQFSDPKKPYCSTL